MAQESRPGILPALYHPMAYARTLQKMLEMRLASGTCHFYEALRINSNPIKQGNQVACTCAIVGDQQSDHGIDG